MSLGVDASPWGRVAHRAAGAELGGVHDGEEAALPGEGAGQVVPEELLRHPAVHLGGPPGLARRGGAESGTGGGPICFAVKIYFLKILLGQHEPYRTNVQLHYSDFAVIREISDQTVYFTGFESKLGEFPPWL